MSETVDDTSSSTSYDTYTGDSELGMCSGVCDNDNACESDLRNFLDEEIFRCISCDNYYCNICKQATWELKSYDSDDEEDAWTCKNCLLKD